MFFVMSLQKKVKQAQDIIEKARSNWSDDEIVVAWTGGKDSTVILHIIKEMYREVPFRALFNDSTIEFKEVYEFIKKIEKEWNVDLIWLKHLPEDLQSYNSTKDAEEKMEIMRIAKINAINYAITEYDIKAFMSGIRWDEHEARSKETAVSKRRTHTRIHPILQFTLDDIWEYIREYKVPYVDLYDKGYKSLGEAPFTNPVKDPNAAERAGREATKEDKMDKLRKLGYW